MEKHIYDENSMNYCIESLGKATKDMESADDEQPE